jgi:hypothetical protein
MIEARSLHIIVSSDHPSADEHVAEAIARVVSRYAVDLTPEIEVNVPQAGIKDRDAEDAHGRNALSDEAIAEGCYRNGTTRARLQSDARHEHYGC